MLKTLNLLILIIFILSGCTGERCIDADDFGFSKFTISSRYKVDELSEQRQGNQIAPWRDSNFRVNGRPLVILVKNWEYGIDRNKPGEVSAWCPWYGDDTNKATLSNFCVKLQDCAFIDGTMCTTTKDAQISNAPCLLRKGVGLYGLIAERGTDPNETFITQRAPSGITFHLGEPVSGYKLLDVNKRGEAKEAGGIVYRYNEPGMGSSAKQQYADSKLYFKILDKYYDDNNGQYRLVIKSGITDSRPDPIEFLTNLVRENLFGTSGDDYGLIRNMYLKITANAGYQTAVKAILTLYILFTAFSFLTGNLNLTHTELIARVIKIGIVSALLTSKYSWSFFNDYLFVYFVGGVEQILQLIRSAAQTGSGSSSIIGLMIAPQTMAKLFSLLFVDWLGFIYILLFLIALYFLFMMVFEATIIYLTALIAIGIIIIMGPIFLCFMLFQITRSLFENWLKQLISYAMQPLILFTGIAFISIIVRGEIYGSLGFRVCIHDFPNLGPLGDLFGEITDATTDAIGMDVSLGNSIFYWWFPVPMRGQDFTKAKAVIPVPEDFIKDDGTLCEAYGCFEERYIELPFLDPIKDRDRLNNFFNGQFVQLDGLLLIFIAVYLLSKFNDLSVSVSKFLSSTSGNLTSLQEAGQQAFAPIKKQLDKPITAAREQLAKGREAISMAAASRYEDFMTKGLRGDALGKGANSAVLDEVKRTYGMNQEDVKAGAIDDYKNALKDKLKEMAPGKSEKDLETEARELASRDYKELGKEFFDIKNFKELASDAKFARDFQDAYVEAHQSMSSRGIGLFGKNIAGFRAIKELNNQIKINKQLESARRSGAIERAYGRLEEGVIGKTLNYRDRRLRTYGETLADEERELQGAGLKAQINRETIKAKDDVLNPEYIAKLEASGRTAEAKYYKELARRKLSYDIYNALISGENPALLGKTFMSIKATDTQLRDVINRTYEVRKEFLEKERYLRHEDKYEVIHEKAKNNIKDKYELLKDHYKRDIKQEEMTTLLANYYNQSIQINADEAKKEVEALKNSFNNIEHSKKVLEEMRERKAHVDKEINSYIDDVNRLRVAANMTEYKKP